MQMNLTEKKKEYKYIFNRLYYLSFCSSLLFEGFSLIFLCFFLVLFGTTQFKTSMTISEHLIVIINFDLRWYKTKNPKI